MYYLYPIYNSRQMKHALTGVTSRLLLGAIGTLALTIMGCGPESYREDEEKFLDSTKEELVEEKDETVVHKSQVMAFQAEMNEQFGDSAHSPLLPDDLAAFEVLEFFNIDPEFSVDADFTRIVSEPFEMPTTTDRKPIYEKYGEANFTLKGKEFVLTLFQSHKSREDSVWKNYLFLSYNDLTNGNDTYGGGRFIDVLMPENGTVDIDFNKSYNPYCAYNHKYSCPIPPEENFLEVRVTAGVKAWAEH